jgi:tryptophan synthase beta chain
MHTLGSVFTPPVSTRADCVITAVLFNLSGHGHFDMRAYTDYFAGKLTDKVYEEPELARALAELPDVRA